MKKLIAWLRKACRTNRVFRTAVQGFASYMAMNLPVFWDGSGDFGVALEALLAGAIAAGISAIWKTAAAEIADFEDDDVEKIR